MHLQAFAGILQESPAGIPIPVSALPDIGIFNYDVLM